MQVIPAIDLMEGRCVRLQKGDFSKQTVYADDPLSVARRFEDAGLSRLHVVDLDGARGKPLSNLRVLETIARHTSLVIDFGGGIKSRPDVVSVLGAGAAMISLGSLFVTAPAEFAGWVAAFGADRFFPGADVVGTRLRIRGWEEDGGIDIFQCIEQLGALHIDTVFCTDISRDGMLEGPSLALYGGILRRFPALKLVASGGVAAYDDLVALRDAGCHGVIIGKAIYEGRITLQQLGDFIKQEPCS